MSALIRLFPGAWRERYEEEFLVLLETRPPTVGDRFDIVRGALDARLHPQVRRGAEDPITDERAADLRAGRKLGVAAVAGAIVWVAAFGVVLMGPVRQDAEGAYRDGSAALPLFLVAMVAIVFGLVGHVIVFPRGARVARASAYAAMPLLLLFGIGPWMWPFGFAAMIFIAIVALGGLRAGTWPLWATTAVALGLLGVVGIAVVGLSLTGLDRMTGGVLFLLAGLCLVPVWLGVGGSLIAGPAPIRLPPA